MATLQNDPFMTHQQSKGFGATQSGNGGAAPPQPAKKAGGRAWGGMAKGRGSNAASLMLLMFFPWLMFVMIACLFTFPYHHLRALVWIIIVACDALACFIIYANARNRHGGTWYLNLGALLLLASLVGVMLGLYNYHEYMFSFWTYDEGRDYSNVLPSEPASAHADAAKIVFSEEARVDTTKAVGFKAGAIFCVAPVLDDTQTSKVEYWAAGTDCCKARSEYTCDDAANPKARSGVVIMDSEGLLHGVLHDFYKKAVKEAEAAFDLVSSDDPLFVRWVVDPQLVQDDYWRSGVGFLVTMSCIYLVISMLFGYVMHVLAKPRTPGPASPGRGV